MTSSFDPRSSILDRRFPARAGISAVEIVITVLIVGILAALVVPRYLDTINHTRAEMAARRVAADLALARREAQLKSAPVTVQFEPAGNSYTLAGVAHIDRPSEAFVVLLAEAPYQCELLSADLGGDAEVIYDGFGRPDSGGTIVVRCGGQVRTVTLNHDSGQASYE
jgi:type II secretory pathway pseudopilin PulG